MKRIFKGFVLFLLLLTVFTGCEPYQETISYKPVIYLYPEVPTEVTVTLDYDGALTHTYPAYRDGWQVTAMPDGTLTDRDGRQYYCLFWEGAYREPYEMTEGFVIKGEDTVAFLEFALAALGLTETEANEFIIYWLPQMEGNPYNQITFQEEVYTERAKLTVTPTPDTIIRIFMTWRPLEKPIEVAPQTLTKTERVGFTVVEWGGSRVE